MRLRSQFNKPPAKALLHALLVGRRRPNGPMASSTAFVLVLGTSCFLLVSRPHFRRLRVQALLLGDGVPSRGRPDAALMIGASAESPVIVNRCAPPLRFSRHASQSIAK